jgi:hypothetical protein
VDLHNDRAFSSPTKHFGYMGKNLARRLTDTPPPPADRPDRQPHDLFEIDRKRKMLLEEVEAIKRIKLEQVTLHFRLRLWIDGLSSGPFLFS